MAKAKGLDISQLRERKDLAQRMRRPFERDWLLNMAYIAGEQYVEYAESPVYRLVDANQDGSTGVRALHNVCIKVARQEAAKILKTRPVPVALPATNNEDDLYTARICGAYFHFLQEEWNFDRRMRDAVDWLVAAGNMHLKWYWDGQMPQVAVVSPFDYYGDPYAKSFLDERWCIHSQFLSEDAVHEIYSGYKGVDLSEVRATETSALSPVESRVFSHFGDGSANLPGVNLMEYWERPSKSVPDGRFVVFTDQTVVYSGKFPYEHGRLPFTHAGHIKRSNSKFFASVIDFIRPLQVELNRAESQIIENRNLANGIWMIPTDVELDTQITGEPRQIIKWQGAPVHDPSRWFVQPQGMAAWVGGEPDRIKATMQDIVSQHEVSNGGVPGRVESGQAIQLLQETDDSVLAASIKSVEECIADGFLMVAFLFKQFATSEQIIRVYDKDGAVEVSELQKDMIPMDMRVRVQTDTGLPQTTAGKWDRVLNLLQYKVIPPERAIELLDLTVVDPDLQPDMQDRKNQYRECKDMLMDPSVIIRPVKWDNHDVHLDELNKFRKTEEFRRKVNEDPRFLENFQFHEDAHLALQKVVDTERTQRQMLLQGQLPPDAGGAPPPPDGGDGPPPDGGGDIQQPQPPEPAPNGSPAPVA